MGCGSKTCPACWIRYREGVIRRALDAICPLYLPSFAYFLYLTAKLGSAEMTIVQNPETVIRWLRKQGASYVAVEEENGSLCVFSTRPNYGGKRLTREEFEQELRAAMERHARGKRLRSSHGINVAQRDRTAWKLIAVLSSDFEQVLQSIQDLLLHTRGDGVECIYIREASETDIEALIEAVGQ